MIEVKEKPAPFLLIALLSVPFLIGLMLMGLTWSDGKNTRPSVVKELPAIVISTDHLLIGK